MALLTSDTVTEQRISRRSLHDEVVERLRDLIVEGQKEGSVKPELEARAVARSIFGALDETLLTLTLARRNTVSDLSHAADQLADLFCDGIAVRAEGASPPTSENV